MLTFRNTVIVYVLFIVGLIGYDYGHELSVWMYILSFIIVSLVVSWGCYFIQSDFFLKAYYEGAQNKNEIAITFDDGPHENTLAILDLLKRYNVKAAFFCIGKNFSGKENVIGRISEEGHVVGNHSFSHHNMFDFFSVEKLIEDVSKTDDLILKITGKKNKLFRPPYGVTTPRIARLVRKMDYKMIGWNVRSYDTTIKNRDKLLHRIFTRMKNGSVILLHDTTPGIEIVLEKVLEHARTKNLKVVSIEDLFQIKAYEFA